jgi:glyceraldehyde 3-phosphate dehydrogenase
MAVKVAINGFGRIGRLVFRAILENAKNDVEVVLINDLTTPVTLAHLLKYDSVHGRFQGTVEAKENALVVNGKTIQVTAVKDPKELPHGKLGVDVVIESTGKFTKKADAGKHIEAGAKKVLISAPANDADLTVVVGVNDELLKAEHKIVSNASCTTNCLAPVVKVLHQNFKVKRGLVTTIHAYTNDQRILDFEHSDLRRARAGALSMIPTKTGAAAAIGLVMPELKGKLDGLAVRVPTPNVSLVDLVAEVEAIPGEDDKAKAKAINAALEKAAAGELKGILAVEKDETVSIDYNHCPVSSTVDSFNTKVLDGNFVKILSWYDNEWAYSCRCVDLIKKMAQL